MTKKLEYFQDLPEELKEIIVQNLLKDKDFWDEELPESEEQARENVLDYINRNNSSYAWKDWV